MPTNTLHDDIAARVAAVFATVFDSVAFDRSLSVTTTSEWTSLRHIQLLSGLEKAFDVEFEPIDIARLTSIEALMSFLASRPT